MPPRKSSKVDHGEKQEAKSPAEFFAENQAIAGFDNLGKSLYTTIREFVENSLDACESVNVLPDIVVRVEEMTMDEFNAVRGVKGSNSNVKKESKLLGGIKDTGLFQKNSKKRISMEKSPIKSEGIDASVKIEVTPTKTKKGRAKRDSEAYFRITVKDNGCGMKHDAIPNLLGIVLSGSKYGVRQTRGKFGLGAKMALIWSKKSTGVPIQVTTSHTRKDGSPGENVSHCILDIDIFKNRPKIIQHTSEPNNKESPFVGTEMQVLIGGNWTTYKSRIVQYLQQLAIITPYAKLELHYSNVTNESKDMVIRYNRRSEQMPPPAREVKHHPSSVNNLVVQQLIDKSKAKTLLKFLSSDLANISTNLAKRVIAELGNNMAEDTEPSSISGKQITRLTQMLRSVELFKAPDGSCLSPLGEYNLNLGIRKVIEPDIVATYRDKPCAYEGHPFIVEAAVSLGGKNAKEGISIIRFANRIPLLFEGGADVVTRVAQSKIKWSSYKIEYKRDKIGVFVSIVSTKIPFKGTGKEYIGDDITEIQLSVKRALQGCCQQLRSHLTKRKAEKDLRERRGRLVKYVPDVSRSLFALLESMRKRRLELTEDDQRSDGKEPKRTKLDQDANHYILKLEKKEITETTLKNNLTEAIEAQWATLSGGENGVGNGDNGSISENGTSKRGKSDNAAQPVYLVPFDNLKNESFGSIIQHPLFLFRPLRHSS